MHRLASILLILSATAANAAALPEKSGRSEYLANCAVCHGDRLQGAPQGTPLNGELTHGESIDALMTSIANGFPTNGMPAWSKTLSEIQIKSLALFLLEIRQGLSYADYHYDTPLDLPEGAIDNRAV